MYFNICVAPFRRSTRSTGLYDVQCYYDRHSFIPDISVAPLQVHYYPTAIPIRAAVNTPKRYWQLRVKDLVKLPTWLLEWDSSLRPSGRTESTTDAPRPNYI